VADKCANCGKAITLEPDANGGERWYHVHKGSELQINCADKGGTAKTVATPAVKAAKETEADEADDEADDKESATSKGGN
jgi:hypothetical protein